ncbi:MAG: GDSL-type esterase/lipase family protein [Paludibacteraceae bacterium]|nr:GDSL-type esterase/lipase family protein [Paludibacteraceae bacterium]
MVKKVWLILSVIANVFLLAVVIYMYNRQPMAAQQDKVQTDVFFSSAYEDGNIVFIGEERLQLCSWKTLLGSDKIANLAIYKNTIKDEIKRASFIFDDNTPSQIVMMLGVQDLQNGTPVNEIYKDFVSYVELLQTKLPQTELIVIPVLPVTPDDNTVYPAITMENIKALNLLIKMYSVEKGLTYVNLFPDFYKEQFDCMKADFNIGDGFHFSQTGYFVFRERLRPYLRLE